MHSTNVTGWVKKFYSSLKYQISLSGVQENIYLYRIYKNILQFQTIKDYHLFVIIAILLLLDCILLTAWSSTHSLYKESVSMTIKVRSINDLCQFVAKRDHVANILYVAKSVVLYSLYNESFSMTIKVSSINGHHQFVIIAILLLLYCMLQTVWSLTHPLYLSRQ